MDVGRPESDLSQCQHGNGQQGTGLLPYAISGGTGTEAYLHWVKKSQSPEIIELTIGGLVDELTMLPEGAKQPITCKKCSRGHHGTQDRRRPHGALEAPHHDGRAPPSARAGSCLPVRRMIHPSKSIRPWIATGATPFGRCPLVYPPWRGTAFTGEAYTRKHEKGFERFEARIDEGKIGGVYSSSNPDNINALNASWDNVPASHLLEHLKLPEIFTGTMTGGIQYSIDQDDSGTSRGRAILTWWMASSVRTTSFPSSSSRSNRER